MVGDKGDQKGVLRDVLCGVLPYGELRVVGGCGKHRGAMCSWGRVIEGHEAKRGGMG